jgi:hypothetical protein
VALDPDTLKYLDEVKKGKPRRFAMVMKGEQIVSLIVYKKGSVEKYKKLARDKVKGGLFYHGVIDGKGQNIAFKLCYEDGFDKPPGKDIKLKSYLKNEADLQFKPCYEMVDELPSLISSDEISTTEAVAAPTTDTAPQAETSATPVPPVDEAFKNKLTLTLNKMTPLIKRVLAAGPERKTEILSPAAKIKLAITEGRLDEAKMELVAYGGFLKGLATAPVTAKDEAPTAPKTQVSPKEASDESAEVQQLFQTIGKFQEVDGINKDSLYEGAVGRLSDVGYEGALKWASDRCDLRATINQFPKVGLNNDVLFSGALPKLDKEGMSTALKWVRAQVDSKRIEQGIDALDDVPGVDKQTLEEKVRLLAEKEGTDRSLAWAALWIEAKKSNGKVEQDYTEAVFNDDGAGFGQLVSKLGEAGAAELHLAFGGRKGLPVVGAVLKDVCKGDVSGLKQLIQALA